MKYNYLMISALLHGQNGYSRTARVVNNVYYLYNTPIARLEGGRVYVDMDYYSNTTSRQRNEIIHACKSNGLHVIELVGTKIVP